MTEEYRVIRSMLYDIIGGVSVANENIGYLLEYEHQRDIENQKLRDEITQLLVAARRSRARERWSAPLAKLRPRLV